MPPPSSPLPHGGTELPVATVTLSARAARLQDIFNSALELTSPADRDAFVLGACAEDAAMHAELCALIAANDAAGGFMRGDDETLSPDLEAQWARLKPEGAGDRVGRYKLLQEIGEGGFGTVWMAEQMEPVSRRVALKIIKLGMDTREVIARFESERQALAMMDHPNIAQVFDAGATPRGRPFFVMELVRGIPITEHCDEAGLGTRGRLALFRDVCSAINHAHQKGVIHRDIKPSNVMITLHGEKPVVKVIDFGVAKATAGKLTDKTLFTRFEQFIGTPVYMSPEQASWSGLDVDTRSDIYSLGILLYELLTGRPPFNPQTMAAAGPDEMRRMIREEEPPRPSTRLRTTAREERMRLAEARQIEPSKVNSLVEPDLDWIVMKAIDKDRAWRYQTANGLSQDIERFLADKTVTARPPTAAYRFRKFARRNKLALRVATAIVTVLLGGMIVSTWLAVRATKAEGRAREQTRLAEKQRMRADREAEAAQQNLYYAQMHLGQPTWREHRGLKYLREILAKWVPTAASPDRRGWEWFYLASLPYQNLRTFTPATAMAKNSPSVVAWNIRSRRLAEGTVGGVIRVWDADKQHTTLTLQAPVPAVEYWGNEWLAWSPDGSKLAAGGRDGTVHVWAAASGQELRVLQAHNLPLVTVAFSSDGTRLAAWEAGGTITIWDAESGALLAEFAHPGGVTAGAWSPDDRLLAAGHLDGAVTFSETQAGAPIVSLQAHGDTIYDLAWSPDSTRIATTSDSDFFVNVWDVASQQKVLGPLRHSHGIAAIAWEPNGERIATGSFDQTVKLWDAVTGAEIVTLRGHDDTITSLAWGPEGRLASAGSYGTLKVWDSLHNQEANLLTADSRRATSVAWSPDGSRLASAGNDGIIRFWDAATRREQLAIRAHDERKVVPQFGLVRSLAWSPDGARIASAGLDGAAVIWDAATGRSVFAFPGGHGAVWCVAWKPDGTALAASSQDGMIGIAEHLDNNPTVRFFQAHQNPGRSVDTPEGIRALAWSPQGDRLASGGFDNLVKIWDPARMTELVRMPGSSSHIISVSWSPDGTILASSAADFLVVTWDAGTGQKLQTMRGHNDFVDAVKWSPNGSRLASAGLDNAVRIWDPRTGAESFVLRGNAGMFHDLSWNGDGARLAAACNDGQIWIWDARPGFAGAPAGSIAR